VALRTEPPLAICSRIGRCATADDADEGEQKRGYIHKRQGREQQVNEQIEDVVPKHGEQNASNACALAREAITWELGIAPPLWGSLWCRTSKKPDEGGHGQQRTVT